MADLAALLINLDRDTDRLAHMQRELDACGIAFERVPAVDGRHLPERFVAPFASSALRPGERGCYVSHLVIHERLAAGAFGDAALILEDDLRIDRDLRQVLAAILEALPARWDIVRLSNPPKRAFVPLAALPGERELVRYSKIPNNTGAYLMSRAGAQKFLDFGPHRRAVDEDMRRPWTCGLDTYGVVAPPIVSNIFDSSIDAMGDRDLAAARQGAARFIPKALTGKTDGPAAAVARLAYNVRCLGVRDWAHCLLRNGLRTISKAKTDNVHRNSTHAGYAPFRVERNGQ